MAQTAASKNHVMAYSRWSFLMPADVTGKGVNRGSAGDVWLAITMIGNVPRASDMAGTLRANQILAPKSGSGVLSF